MKSHILRKNLFILIFFILNLSWLFIGRGNKLIDDGGNNILTVIAYLVTLIWMIYSYKIIKGQRKFFWLLFAMGTCFLFISQLFSMYHQFQFGRIPVNSVEDIIRLIGYLFFFSGLLYQMKVLKNTLPMLRFLLNIMIVITAVFSVSWYFIVNPILVGNGDVTQIGFFISSIYHVLNISLLFATVCLIFITQRNQNKVDLYLIAVGFLIQVVGDFIHINHVKHVGNWIVLLWPMSILLMGLGSIYSAEFQWNQNKEDEELDYKKYHLSFVSAGILFVFTFFNQLNETNILQKGLHITVLLLLLQQVITTVENKQVFKKLKLLASSDGNFRKTNNGKEKQDSEMARLLKKIEKLAHFDPLTELPNRTFFQKCMEQELKAAEKNKTNLSLMYIDMDRFKYVNDSLGHDSGDFLLKKVASRLKDTVDETSIVARIGGDEFAIILLESDKNILEDFANKILQLFEKSFNINGHELYTTPSIGISIFPRGGRNTKDLLKSADAAMYLAKEEGKNKYKFFDPSLNEMMLKKMDLESRLRRGLEDHHLILHYQPQVDLRTEKIIGLEALIRWNDPELGMISPVDFIPLAEETGLIEPLGMWVIRTACLQLKKWQEIGLTDVSISVNVSIRQFQNPNFVKEVENILNETKLNPQFLKIEITESILQNINKTLRILNDLREIGIQIAIDDFGTGYSSLSYLKNLPVNCLKIDKAFIDELSENPDGPIVKTIIDMGRNMNFTVIAEGVESQEHVDFLRKNNCFVGQGFLFSKPLPASALEHFMQKKMIRIS